MALIRQRLNIEPKTTPGRLGQFDVLADGKLVVTRGGNFITRQFGAGYPDMSDVVDRLQKLQA